MNSWERWLSASAKLKTATVALAMSSLIYLFWALALAADIGADVAVPYILVFFAIDFIAAILVFFILGFGKTLGILKGFWGLVTIIITIINPSIEIFGIEITGLFQASTIALVWSALEAIAGFCLLAAPDFRKNREGDL
jgi:hypothetical protein